MIVIRSGFPQLSLLPAIRLAGGPGSTFGTTRGVPNNEVHEFGPLHSPVAIQVYQVIEKDQVHHPEVAFVRANRLIEEVFYKCDQKVDDLHAWFRCYSFVTIPSLPFLLALPSTLLFELFKLKPLERLPKFQKTLGLQAICRGQTVNQK